MNKEDYFKYYIQGSDHYLLPKDIFNELFQEMVNWKEEAQYLRKILHKININGVEEENTSVLDLINENKELQTKYNKVLTMLANHYPPCEIDGFMDKNTDYCSINCGVDEEIFKECWDRYITQNLEGNNE